MRTNKCRQSYEDNGALPTVERSPRLQYIVKRSRTLIWAPRLGATVCRFGAHRLGETFSAQNKCHVPYRDDYYLSPPFLLSVGYIL